MLLADKMTAPIGRAEPVDTTSVRQFSLVVFALAFGFIVLNLIWIWQFRYEQPLDIDEAGYIGLAFNDYNNLVQGGIKAWFAAVDGPGAQAPLTPALTSLLFSITGPHVIAGFLVPILFGAASIVATFYLGAALGSPAAGFVASFLLATCPVIINYSRSYHFSMLATFLTVMALIAMVRSQRFSQLGWSLLFGVFVGLLPLARTMTLGFLPGLAVGILIWGLSTPERRLYRFFVLCGAALVALLIVGIWLLPNFSYVWNYLTNYAYGPQSLEYGRKKSLFGGWEQTLSYLINKNIFLPEFLLICVGLVIGLVHVLMSLLRNDRTVWLIRAAQSPLLPLFCFAAAGIVALNSTPNKGSAFPAPLMPAAFLLSVWLPLHWAEGRGQRRVPLAAVSLFCLFASLPFLNLTWKLADCVIVKLPILGGFVLSDGVGTIEAYESAAGLSSNIDNEPVLPVTGRAWMDASMQTAKTVVAVAGKRAFLALGFRNHLYNVNTINLALIRTYGQAFAMVQLDPQVTGQSEAGYENWLKTDAANACVLLTSDTEVPGDFNPPVIRPMMVEAARKAGFKPSDSWVLPDAEKVTLWLPKVMPPSCQTSGAQS